MYRAKMAENRHLRLDFIFFLLYFIFAGFILLIGSNKKNRLNSNTHISEEQMYIEMYVEYHI